MNSKTIKRLIQIVEESQIDALEVSNWWRRVKITRKQPSLNGQPPQIQAPEQMVARDVAVPAVPTAPAPVVAEPAPEPAVSTNLLEIKSPMVGTFYSSPSPESPVFVKVGDSVGEGTVVCIVEAMKLMNEIESEVTGKVSKILVENAQPVEFGQPLFLIDTAN